MCAILVCISHIETYPKKAHTCEIHMWPPHSRKVHKLNVCGLTTVLLCYQPSTRPAQQTPSKPYLLPSSICLPGWACVPLHVVVVAHRKNSKPYDIQTIGQITKQLQDAKFHRALCAADIFFSGCSSFFSSFLSGFGPPRGTWDANGIRDNRPRMQRTRKLNVAKLDK